MTSEVAAAQAFVWIWLADATEPVVAGRLSRDGDQLLFNYGRSYLERPGAKAIYPPELPLKPGLLPLPPGLTMPGCIRDSAPDAWGRRVIINRRFGQRRDAIDIDQLDELSYLLESGSDRVGALDFQRSASVYEPRQARDATLEELMAAADLVERGVPLPPELELALFHGSSLGGARPKAMISRQDRKFIAKFSSGSDLFNVVKAEYVAMRLAALCGLNVAPVRLAHVAGKDVLLVERFDRRKAPGGWTRRVMVSALTLLGLEEMMARYASYEDLTSIIRARFSDPIETLKELFGRLVFNILCGNTDDHARNHAAFVEGETLTLTPAYDICPQGPTGGEASQAMLISGQNRMSRLSACLAGASAFLLDQPKAQQLLEDQVSAIRRHWAAVCDEAALGTVDRNLLWRRQILNPFAFEGLQGPLARLADGD